MRTLMLFVVFTLISQGSAFAQDPYGGSMVPRSGVGRGVRGYTAPGGNTLPNSLNYFRQDVGVLDNYNTFIAPRQRLNRDLKLMTRQQQTDSALAQKQIGQLKASTAAPTGTAAGYMQHSRFFGGR